MFGAWKSKFQCLKRLRLKLSTSLAVVNACAVLWNFLLEKQEITREDIELVNAVDDYCLLPSTLTAGTSRKRQSDKRDKLVQSYFTCLLKKHTLPADVNREV